MSKSELKTNPVNVFLSYCHKDEQHKISLEKHLNLLSDRKEIKAWSDHKIRPGESISKEIAEKLNDADIVVFLISPDFIASNECKKEWETVKKFPESGRQRIRIPIILRPCPWEDFLDEEDIKALPKDGKPIIKYKNADDAWLEIYKSLKAEAQEIRKNFSPKSNFIYEMERTELVSERNIKLQDIFEFSRLTWYKPSKNSSSRYSEELVENIKNLLQFKYCLIHGDATSGKTAFARYIFLSLVEDSKPVLFVDLKASMPPPNIKALRNLFESQFYGDYSLWSKQSNSTIVIDNLSSDPKAAKFVQFALTKFENVIVTASTSVYRLYFDADENFAIFKKMKITRLSRQQQESLIRKRLEFMDTDKSITDGFVDQVEKTVDDIIANRIVPRYPFFVLTIVQTFETFVPSNISITAYGHCYYVLIISSLVKAGIGPRDKDIETCLNFARHLAFAIYEGKKIKETEFSGKDFGRFVKKYQEKYMIPEHIINRMKHKEYGILSDDGMFRHPYMYYFFLGMYLSRPGEQQKSIVERMCQFSHISSNHLTLLFVIHHATDDQVIDDILLMTMRALDSIKPATLQPSETESLREISTALPNNVLSDNSVQEERAKERQARDRKEEDLNDHDEDEEQEGIEIIDDLYRILKNNEILGQVLRNKCGTLTKDKLEEIVETVADGGLRLVSFFLKDGREINKRANIIKKANPSYSNDIEKFRRAFQSIFFLLTVGNIERVVEVVSCKDIEEIVRNVVKKKKTPSYDLIGYFSDLDSSDELSESLSERLETLLSKYRQDPFIKGILSLRTQFYINTHRSKTPVEQRVCSALGLTYKYKEIKRR